MIQRILVAIVGLQIATMPAADMFIGAGQNGVVHVGENDDLAFSGRMAISDEGSLVKTGLGAFTLPGCRLSQNWMANLTVAEGSMCYLPPNQAELENPVPAVLEKALIWVSAKDPDMSHFGKEGDNLKTWYDVRETNVADPKHLRAEADFTHTAEYPVVTTKDGFESVYFGGLASGKAMKFYRPGSTSFSHFSGVFHIFAVVGNYASQGAVFGSGTSQGNFFYVNLAGVAGYNYANSALLWPSTQRSRVYVNGERFDAYNGVSPKKCFHLLDAGGPVSGIVGSFYAQNSRKDSWGGDYLSEAIAFTNELSEVERVQVASYLSRKWFGRQICTKNISVAEDAAVVLDAADGDLHVKDVNLHGTGQLVKRGAGTAYFRSADVTDGRETAFGGSVKIESGSLDLATSVPLTLARGGKISAETDADVGRLVTTVQDGSETLEKSGAGDLSICSVAPSVKTLTVSDGVLDIRPPRTGLAALEVRKPVQFANPGFETFATDEEWTEADGVLDVPRQDAHVLEYRNGWRRCNNKVLVFNFDKWVGTGGIAGATRDDWGIKHHPHEGRCAAWLSGQNAVLATPAEIAEPGVYEVGLDVYCLEADTYLGGYATISLWDTSTKTEVTNFGRIYAYDFSFRRVALRSKVDLTGAFELRIHLHNEDNGHPVIVDNLEMNLLPDMEMSSWPIPGGNFEYDQTLFGDGNRTRITASPIGNVTLNQGAGRASIVTMAVRNETESSESRDNVECNGSRFVEPGFRQLQLAKDSCSATISAVPAAGTYLLQAAVARYHQYAGAVTASIKIGSAEAVELGTQIVSQTIMKPVAWPTAFTVDGTEPVAIEFSFERSENASSDKTGVWIDDVMFVDAISFNDRRNYLDNGGFESGADSGNWAKTIWTRIGYPDSRCNVQPYDYRPDLFSSDMIDGKYFLYLERGSGAAQTVDFDRPGVYRLSFHSAVSLQTPADFWVCTPIKAWFAQGGVTNVIGVTPFFANTNYVQTVWDFKVEKAGTYVFGLQGTCEDSRLGGNACVDAVSVRYLDGIVPTANESTPVLDAELKVTVAEGAKLRLSFDGTNRVSGIYLGGHRVTGVVNQTTHPEYIEGFGSLAVNPTGMVFVVR